MEKHKKALYLAPVVLIPIMTILFNSFGGGSKPNQKNQHTGSAFNANIPAPSKKSLPDSKWESYEMASIADRKEKENRQRDKYFFPKDGKKAVATEQIVTSTGAEQKQWQSSQEEEELRQQLAEYMQEKPTEQQKKSLTLATRKETKRKQVQKGKKTNPSSSPTEKTPLTASVAKPRNRFYSLGAEIPEQEKEKDNTSTSIAAVIHHDQTVSNGSVVKIRLLQDLVATDGTTIPKNSFVYGKASLSIKRLHITINSTMLHEKIHPVSLFVYDTDGMEGLNVPDSMARERTEDAVAEATSAVPTGLEAVSPGVVSATANAAVGAVKSLVRGKVKEEKVHLKAGYKIFLTNS